jgi:phage terminase large subunit
MNQNVDLKVDNNNENNNSKIIIVLGKRNTGMSYAFGLNNIYNKKNNGVEIISTNKNSLN